jgi:hypothetical protein
MVKKVSKIPKGKIKPFLTSQREKLEDQRQKKLNPENIKELPKEKPEIKLSKVQMMMQRISIGFDTPDEIMAVIQEVFSETEPYPRPGNIYTFVYTAKTPGILYDQHPLSIIDSITLSGFRGYNVHWSEFRNYVWEGVESSFHIIRKGDEFNYLHDIPYKKILSTRPK